MPKKTNIEDLMKLRPTKEKRKVSDLSYDELKHLVECIVDIYEDQTDIIDRHDCVYDELYVNALMDF